MHHDALLLPSRLGSLTFNLGCLLKTKSSWPWFSSLEQKFTQPRKERDLILIMLRLPFSLKHAIYVIGKESQKCSRNRLSYHNRGDSSRPRTEWDQSPKTNFISGRKHNREEEGSSENSKKVFLNDTNYLRVEEASSKWPQYRNEIFELELSVYGIPDNP